MDEIRRADERRHERGGGLTVDDFRRRDLLDPAADHHGHPVAQGQGLVLVMGHEDGRGPGRAQDLADIAAELGPQRRVQRRERLIKEDDVGPGRQRPRDGDALLHATRQVMRHPMTGVGQVDEFEQLADPHLAIRVAAEPVADVVADGKMREQRHVLEDHPDAPALRGNGRPGPGHAPSADLDGPGIGSVQAGDQPQDGGLPTAGRAQHREHLAREHVQIDVVDGDHVPEHATETADGDRRGRAHRDRSSARSKRATVATDRTSRSAAGPAARA